MIWSVSTLARSSGATRPFSKVNLSISSPLANVDEVPGDRGRRGHLRAHEVGPAAGALAALEIALRLRTAISRAARRSEEHTSELQSRQYLVCRLLLEKKKQ